MFELINRVLIMCFFHAKIEELRSNTLKYNKISLGKLKIRSWNFGEKEVYEPLFF